MFRLLKESVMWILLRLDTFWSLVVIKKKGIHCVAQNFVYFSEKYK